MQVLRRPWGAMHFRVDGPPGAPAVVFANSLGTDLRLWDPVLPLLPGLRLVRYDLRGHGLSDSGPPDPGLTIDDLAGDLAALIGTVAPAGAVVVGLSIGGAIAQALAAARPGLVRALVLSNTAVRLGTPEAWQARMAAIGSGGMAAIADPVMERWFAAEFRAGPDLALWRNMMLRTDPAGYVAACRVLAETDLTASTSGLRLPALVIAGDRDGASPPEQVAATAALIPGAQFHILAGAGHLPCVETPAAWAAIAAPFLKANAA